MAYSTCKASLYGNLCTISLTERIRFDFNPFVPTVVLETVSGSGVAAAMGGGVSVTVGRAGLEEERYIIPSGCDLELMTNSLWGGSRWRLGYCSLCRHH